MQISEIYNLSKKKNFIHKNRSLLQNMNTILDPNDKYIKNGETQISDIYLNNLFLQYFNSKYRDELIKVSDDGQYITFPKPNSNNYYVLRKNIIDPNRINVNDKEYNLNLEVSSDHFLFETHPELLGNTNIDIKNYEGYHNNKIMDLDYFHVSNYVKHIFSDEKLNEKKLNEDTEPRFFEYIIHNYKLNKKLQERLNQCIQLRLESYANNSNEKMLHFVNGETNIKSGCIEIKFPFLVDNKLVEYPMMIICEYNQNEEYYEPRTILDIPGVFPKSLVFEGLEHESMTLENRTKATEVKKFLNKVYEQDRYTGIELLTSAQIESYYKGTLDKEKSSLTFNKEEHYFNKIRNSSFTMIINEEQEINFEDERTKDILTLRYMMNKELLTTNNILTNSKELSDHKKEIIKDNNIIQNYYNLPNKLSSEQIIKNTSETEKVIQMMYLIEDLTNISNFKNDEIYNKLPNTPLISEQKELYYNQFLKEEEKEKKQEEVVKDTPSIERRLERER